MEGLLGFVSLVVIVAFCGAILMIPIGWVMNVYDLLVNCDFASPYKAEVLRGIGVFVAPLGGILGWINIGK